MKRFSLVLVAVVAFGFTACNAQNSIKTPAEVGKAVVNLIKEYEEMSYSDFAKYFVNAEDCGKLAVKTKSAEQKRDFQETAKQLTAGNYYEGYDNFREVLPYLKKDGYDLKNLTFVDFWYEEAVVNGISCVVGIVIMKSNDKYLIADPTAVKTDNGYKLIRLEHKAFNWCSGVTEVRDDGNICGNFGGEEIECNNFKEAIKSLKDGGIRLRMTVR